MSNSNTNNNSNMSSDSDNDSDSNSDSDSDNNSDSDSDNYSASNTNSKEKNIKIASWDVGIINLSLCILEKNTNNKKVPFKIHKWKNINLLDEDGKDCEDCDKEAKWYYNDEKNEHYYCGTHKNVKNVLNAAKKNEIKKYSCCHAFKIKGKKCTDSIVFVINKKTENLHYCKKHKPSNIHVIKPFKKIGANKMPIEELQLRLMRELEKLDCVFDVDKVVIENQPSLKAPKMKSIASTLFNYYLLRSKIDKDNYGKKMRIKKVVFQSPSNKLKLDDNNKLILDKTKGKHKYKMTKDLGIKYSRKLLKYDKKNLDFLNKQKKKDDFADSFLQGCYHLEYKC